MTDRVGRPLRPLRIAIALAAVLSLAAAPALGGQVCRPAPADTSTTGYEMAANKCCDPYDDSSASDTCRNETIEMAIGSPQCSISAECHVPAGTWIGNAYIAIGYHNSTSITVSWDDVDDLRNCTGTLTNGSC